jgi:hypothetical protein
MEDSDFVQCFSSFVVSYYYDNYVLRPYEVIGDTLQTIYLQFN